jgi:hypothetical protein
MCCLYAEGGLAAGGHAGKPGSPYRLNIEVQKVTRGADGDISPSLPKWLQVFEEQGRSRDEFLVRPDAE